MKAKIELRVGDIAYIRLENRRLLKVHKKHRLMFRPYMQTGDTGTIVRHPSGQAHLILDIEEMPLTTVIPPNTMVALSRNTPMRKLASIQKIDDIQPIEGADAIDVATIGGWNVVVKKGAHSVGELVIYFEIDSWIPENLAPFLGNGQPAKVYEEVAGFRLKTKKLRGVVSQGLIIPIADAPALGLITDVTGYTFAEGDDVTEVLNVKKYEKAIAANLAGFARGNFPTFIPKTDQERIQNLKRDLNNYIADALEWEITEKLDGTSCTVYKNSALLDEGKDALGVCSRNLDLKETEGNVYWDAAKKYDIHAILLRDGRNLAVQGEIIGEGLQGNKYKFLDRRFYVFDIYDIDRRCYFTSQERLEFCNVNGLTHTPVISAFATITADADMTSILAMADGESTLAKTAREGLVFKCVSDPSISFKAISNKWLLKNDE